MKFTFRRCFSGLAFVAALSSSFGAEQPDSLEVQAARAKLMMGRGYTVHYPDHTFDLSDLPSYRPEGKISGTIRVWGSNYFGDSPLAGWWEEAFKKYHPDARFDFHLKTTLHAIPGLIFDRSDIGPMGRQITWDEMLSYQREFNAMPVGLVAVTGSYDVGGWNPAIGIYVHKDNPLAKLTLQQLDGIFLAERTGAWRELNWETSLARGPEKDIRTWGQLGLTGEWADKPIHVYGFNLQFHFPQEITSRSMGGITNKWNPALREYANTTTADGSLKGAGEIMLGDLQNDKYGIAYCAGGQGWTGGKLKTLALAAKAGAPYYELTLANVRARTYPMYADVFFFIKRAAGVPLDPKVKEFMRFILSREGQALAQRDGKYLPLTAAVIREELRKLE